MELDLQLLEWMLDERTAGRPVSNLDLKEQARTIGGTIEELEGFQGSDGFIRRWKRRNNVAIRRGTNESQKLPEEFGAMVTDFKELVQLKRTDEDYIDVHIGNMDQTMCRFDMAPKATNHTIGDRTVRIAATGGSKKGFTVALAGLANGTKLPAFVVFREGRNAVIPPRVMANLHVPQNVRLTASQNGWMTGDKMASWVNRVWGANEDDVRRLLILDQARIHTMQQTLDNLQDVETDVIFVPAGCTPICQPADVSWNTPFKAAMRQAWKEWRRRDERTAQGNLKMASR